MPKKKPTTVKTLYQCPECELKYPEKKWAEKCSAWCKKHKSCNLKIVSHAIKEAPAAENVVPAIQKIKTTSGSRLLTFLLYFSFGATASLALFLFSYWSLRLDSNLAALIGKTKSEPVYLWSYLLLSIGSILLFGINSALFLYSWRKWGRPSLRQQGGSGGGSLLAILSSACPVCGSTLLSALGIVGGLAVFPLQGLELKALSFGLLFLSFLLLRRGLIRHVCRADVCPPHADPAYKPQDGPWLIITSSIALALLLLNLQFLQSEPLLSQIAVSQKSEAPTLAEKNLISSVIDKVLPPEGFQSKIVLGQTVVKLVENGVIDTGKFQALYAERGGLPKELKAFLDQPSDKPILLSRENANLYINLFWPLGLANFMEANKESPLAGPKLFNFASTGGWSLGQAENGGVYFNKFKIVKLAPEEEAIVLKIAKNSYRPCCNNSTFFQDCNHGSALLGVLQLGANLGLTEDELWREALAFNSFWFPQTYIETALYFQAVEKMEWEKIDPKVVLGKNFSSASGWTTNIEKEVRRLGLLPQTQEETSCGT